MTTDEQRELYLLLRHDEAGANRGREFYDGCCRSCDSRVYETHADECPLARLLESLGGNEEVARQAVRRMRRDLDLRAQAETMKRWLFG